MRKGTMARAASGSAHHHPRGAFATSPTSRNAERSEQTMVSMDSATMALLPIFCPMRRFARASGGIRARERTAMTMPGRLGADRAERAMLRFLPEVVAAEPPDQDDRRGNLDSAVEAEADQGDGEGDEPERDGGDCFAHVVGGGEPGKPQSTADQDRAVVHGRRDSAPWNNLCPSTAPNRRGISGGPSPSSSLPASRTPSAPNWRRPSSTQRRRPAGMR